MNGMEAVAVTVAEVEAVEVVDTAAAAAAVEEEGTSRTNVAEAEGGVRTRHARRLYIGNI